MAKKGSHKPRAGRKYVPNPRVPLSRFAKQAGWEIVTCITCRGSGQYRGHTCGLCEGYGKITVHK